MKTQPKTQMKISELRKLIREEASRLQIKEAGLSSTIQGQIDGLIEDTIVPAFFEDMGLTGGSAKKAMQYLIQKLQKYPLDNY